MHESRKEDFVLVLDDKVYVDRDFLRIDKNNRHLQLAYSVSEVRALPNVAYLVNRFAFGDRHPYPATSPHVDPKSPCYSFRDSTTPPEALPDFELVISKYHGYKQCGVLIPNMYNFNELGKWNATGQTLGKAAAKLPWVKRLGKAFWRGQILAQPKCHRDGGNYARWQVLALSRQYPTEVEADCLDGKPCAFRNETAYPCPNLPYDDVMRTLHTEPRAEHSKPAVPFADFLNYKFLLNVPGTISGSYSRHLNVLWGLATLVLLWDSPHVEWYYPVLRHDVTHVSVTAGTARDAVVRLRDDRQAAERLVRLAQRVHKNFLTADKIADYLLRVFLAVHDHFGLGAVLDGRDAAGRDARARLLNRVTSDPGRRLLQVKFAATPNLGEPAKRSKSIPFMFTRDVEARGDLLVPTGQWVKSDWVPGRGA